VPDLVDVLELDRKIVETIFATAAEIEHKKLHKSRWCLLENKIVALAFFEPSTRTRLSFEESAYRLCAKDLTIVGEEATSLAKGESLHDTVKILDEMSDLIVLRHQRDGAAKYAAQIAAHPVINAGDGKNQHPTQSLIDLYVVKKLKGTVDDLSYGIVGDLRYARTAKSFMLLLSLFKPRSLYLLAPDLLKPSKTFLEELRSRGLRIFEVERLEDILSSVDVLYVTRIQKERFPDPSEYEKVRGSYKITLDMLRRGREGLIVLHPLPRVDELDVSIDNSPYAAYFEQVRSSIPIRMSVLAWASGVIA